MVPRMKVAIVNLGQIVSGDWRNPFVAGDTIITEGERIVSVGTAEARAVESADVVIDAGGMTAIPGLIDSHVHITFGDYTPRQRTVGYLESYLHGGTTTAISASEVHVPGRPKDPEGVKALALAAQRCFADYRPGGMRVIAGSVILEPGLKASDFDELKQKGVRLAKAGFGAVKTAYDYVPLVADAKAAGLITTCHTGGSSIPGSGAITGDHLLKMHPHVSFHINGGPTAMPDADFERVIKESEMALQVCTAGNLRTTLLCARLADQHNAFDRFIIATDTPTGSGIMPLGMLYTIAHLASLTDMPPERFICAATGSNARVYGLDSGLLAPGKAADIVLIDAPDGGTQSTALAAIKHGDIAAIGAVVTAGVPRFVGRSRNTPGTTRQARVARSRSGYSSCRTSDTDRRTSLGGRMIYQQLINGLMLGASYSLVAIGYTLIFGVLRLLYFAHGEVFMVGAFVGLYLVVLGGANIYLALLGAMVLCALLGRACVLRHGPAGAAGPPARAADQLDRAHHRPAKSRRLYLRRPAVGVSGSHQAAALPPRAGHHQFGADFHPRASPSR